MATRPHRSPAYQLRLYPLSLERSALVAQLAAEEENAHEAVRIAYQEEKDRVEDEWRKGRDRGRGWWRERKRAATSWRAASGRLLTEPSAGHAHDAFACLDAWTLSHDVIVLSLPSDDVVLRATHL